MIKQVILTVAASVIAVFLIPTTPAQAATTVDGHTVEVSTDSTDVLWVEATLSATDADSVRVEIFSPRERGPRELWQRCKFTFSGAGTYRCGIDVAAGTLAQREVGTWNTSVTIDGAKVAQARFSVSR